MSQINYQSIDEFLRRFGIRLSKNQMIVIGVLIALLIFQDIFHMFRPAEDAAKNSSDGSMVEEFTRAINSDPENYDAYVNRGYYKSEYGDYKGAMEDFNKALEINPGYSKAYANIGATKIKSGDKEGGCSDLMKATDIVSARVLLEKHCGKQFN